MRFFAIISFLILGFCFFCDAQSYADKNHYLIDSLELDKLTDVDRHLLDSCLKDYHAAENDIEKINALVGICGNMNNDIWIKYQYFQHKIIEDAMVAQASLPNGPTAIAKASLKKSHARSLNNIGFIYDYKGSVKKSLKYYNKSLKILNEIDDKEGIANSYNNIGLLYFNQGEMDTSLNYYQKSITILEETDDKQTLAKSFNNIGGVYNYQGEIDKAMEYYQKGMEIREETGDQLGIAVSLNNIGSIYDDQGQVEKGLDCYFKSLKIREDLGDQKGVAHSLINIGSIYSDQGEYEKVMEYYERSLKIQEEIGDKHGQAACLNNIGIVHYKQKKLGKALKYYNESFALKKEMGNKHGMATSLNNIAAIYNAQGEIAKAITYYKESVSIGEKLGDKQGISNSLFNIGIACYKQGDVVQAKKVAERSFKLATQVGFPVNIKNSAKLLSAIYSNENQNDKALEMYKLYILMRDSLNNERNQKTAARLEAKYQYEKQKAIDTAENEKRLVIEKQEKEKQQLITYTIAGGLGLVIIFLIFVANRLKLTRRQKAAVETAHLNLEEKNREIIDSITYAERIQSAILPPINLIRKLLPDSFVLYKPKDIVAGDFYWLESSQSLSDDDLNGANGTDIYFSAADCTGHGVPGAMMSVMCSTALTRCVKELGLTAPAQILDETSKIIESRFERSEQLVLDGMDLALCKLNLKSKKLEYSGANNPLWIIRKGEIITTKADKQPIGQYDDRQPYTNYELQLQDGDIIYIFSDGYVDQFGGPKGKKFKSKALKTLLLSMREESMDTQMKLLNENFENWRGDLEQVDDVCIIGVKV